MSQKAKSKKQLPKSKKPGRPRSEELDEIAKKLDVTRRQAARIKDSGADVDDLKAAKLRKINLECEKLQMQMEVLRREYFPTVKIYEHFLSAFTAFKAELMQWESTLPPMLAGLNEIEMQPKVRALVEETLNRLADRNWPK